MTATEIFAKRFKELRENEMMSQIKAAEILGITAQSLSLYEKGMRTINIDLLKKVSEYFGVSSDYLIGLSDTPVTDTDMKAVCEYTGISDIAIKALMRIHQSRDDKDYEHQYPKVTRECYLDCVETFIAGYLDDFLIEILDNNITLYYLQNDLKRFEKELEDELNGVSNGVFSLDEMEKTEEMADFCRYRTNRNVKKLLDEYLERVNWGWDLINGHKKLWNMTHKEEISDNGEHTTEEE